MKSETSHGSIGQKHNVDIKMEDIFQEQEETLSRFSKVNMNLKDELEIQMDNIKSLKPNIDISH
jgi:hypothetical protein